nr:M23 family metallopeptidase [Isachenkonia alkalipeptolytica]
MIIASFLLVTSGMYVFANEIDEKKDSLKEVEERQKAVESQIQDKSMEEAEIIEKIETLEMEIIETEDEIDRLEGQISETTEKIEDTKEELVEAEETIVEKNDTLESRLDTMYRRGNIGYIEVLLGSGDFTELLTNVDMIRKIANQDVELIEELEEQRNLIASKKKMLEDQEAKLVSYQEDAKDQKEQLQVSRGTQVSLRREVQSAIGQMEEELNQKEQESQNLQAEIQELQEAERARLEAERRRKEEERKAQEQAAKEEATKDQGSQEQVDTSRPSVWPVPGYTRISSPYGNRTHPVLGGTRFHAGIDIPAPSGTPVVAAASGTVIMSQYSGSYGNVVVIDHGNGISTLYAHNSRNQVSRGQQVQGGETIARIGTTGMSTGPHLHFEVQRNGNTTNPMDWLRN